MPRRLRTPLLLLLAVGLVVGGSAAAALLGLDGTLVGAGLVVTGVGVALLALDRPPPAPVVVRADDARTGEPELVVAESATRCRAFFCLFGGVGVLGLSLALTSGIEARPRVAGALIAVSFVGLAALQWSREGLQGRSLVVTADALRGRGGIRPAAVPWSEVVHVELVAVRVGLSTLRWATLHVADETTIDWGSRFEKLFMVGGDRGVRGRLRYTGMPGAGATASDLTDHLAAAADPAWRAAALALPVGVYPLRELWAAVDAAPRPAPAVPS